MHGCNSVNGFEDSNMENIETRWIPQGSNGDWSKGNSNIDQRKGMKLSKIYWGASIDWKLIVVGQRKEKIQEWLSNFLLGQFFYIVSLDLILKFNKFRKKIMIIGLSFLSLKYQLRGVLSRLT